MGTKTRRVLTCCTPNTRNWRRERHSRPLRQQLTRDGALQGKNSRSCEQRGPGPTTGPFCLGKLLCLCPTVKKDPPGKERSKKWLHFPGGWTERRLALEAPMSHDNMHLRRELKDAKGAPKEERSQVEWHMQARQGRQGVSVFQSLGREGFYVRRIQRGKRLVLGKPCA
jgi:hypothetical protein